MLPLRIGESDATYEPSFCLEGISVNEETPFGYQTSIHISNEQPIIVKPLALAYSITPKDGSEPAVQFETKSVEMAPSTAMAYAVRQDAALEPGDYTASVTLTYRDEVYTFDEMVTVPAQP